MPDNSGYQHAAYLVAGLVYGLYTLSLILRRRSIRTRHARFEQERAGQAAPRR